MLSTGMCGVLFGFRFGIRCRYVRRLFDFALNDKRLGTFVSLFHACSAVDHWLCNDDFRRIQSL